MALLLTTTSFNAACVASVASAAHQRAGQHRAAVDDVPAFLDRFERGIETGERELGQEAKRAEVDAEDQRSRLRHGARRGKQRAVAAEDQGQSGRRVADIAARNHVRCREIFGTLSVDHDRVARALQPFFKRRQHLATIPDVRLGDDGNGLLAG